HGVTDVAELPRRGARLAADLAQFAGSLPRPHVGDGIDAQAVVVRIADQEVAVAVDAEAAGPAVAVIGGGPGGAEVAAVAVVDLDGGGETDDIEVVIAVNGHSAGLLEVAVLHAPTAPDQLRLGVRAAAASEGRQEAGAQITGQSAPEEDGHQVLAFG